MLERVDKKINRDKGEKLTWNEGKGLTLQQDGVLKQPNRVTVKRFIVVAKLQWQENVGSDTFSI